MRRRIGAFQPIAVIEEDRARRGRRISAAIALRRCPYRGPSRRGGKSIAASAGGGPPRRRSDLGSDFGRHVMLRLFVRGRSWLQHHDEFFRALRLDDRRFTVGTQEALRALGDPHRHEYRHHGRDDATE